MKILKGNAREALMKLDAIAERLDILAKNQVIAEKNGTKRMGAIIILLILLILAALIGGL